jgi:hypothetical protein
VSVAAVRRAAAAGGLIAGLLLVLAAPAFAATASGKVVMGTAGVPLPGELRVAVLQTDENGEPQGSPSFAPVAPDGSFSFDADPAKGYLIGLFHQGVTYSRLLEPGEAAGVDLTIFETTLDPSVVRIASDSMTILQSTAEGQSDVLEVLQLLRFTNESDRAYTGSDPAPAPGGAGSPAQGEQPREVLKLPLPESAYDLAPADAANGAGLATAQGRLVATTAVVPGETSVAYLYKVKVPRSGWQLRREVYHPTDHADLLIGKSLELGAAPGFRFQEDKKLGGIEYARWRSGELNPGAVLQADIGFPSGSTNGVWFGFATVVAVLGALFFAGSIRLRRRRAARAAAGAGPDEAQTPEEPSRTELIEQVAALDLDFEAGSVEQAEYDSRRSSLLDKLSRLSTEST